MKNLLFVILTLIAGSLAYLKVTSGRIQVASPSPSMVSSPVASANPTANWPVFTGESFDVRYPPEATASAGSGGIDTHESRIVYMGDIQKASGRTQTELWDGYAVTITRFDSPSEVSAQSQAEVEHQGIVDACGQDKATPIASKKLGQYDTHYYHGGCLGTADHYYLTWNNVLYRVTVMIEKPSDQKMDYQAIIDNIVSSLRFK